MQIVKKIKTLKAMEKQGLITLHHDTGLILAGGYIQKGRKCYYIADYASPRFTFKGNEYKTTYLDGCFYPFVELVSK